MLVLPVIAYNQTQIENSSKPQLEYVVVGNQKWMAQDLNITKFRNGDPIPQAINEEEWIKYVKEGKPAWCYFNFSETSYSKIYNFHAIIDKRMITPIGWRIPNNIDVKELESFICKGTLSLCKTDIRNIISKGDTMSFYSDKGIYIGNNELGLGFKKCGLLQYIGAYHDYQYSKDTKIYSPSKKYFSFREYISFWYFIDPIDIKQNRLRLNKSLVDQLDINTVDFQLERADASSFTIIPIANSVYRRHQSEGILSGYNIRCIKDNDSSDFKWDDGRYMKKGKWGLKQGKEILPAQYDEISELRTVEFKDRYGGPMNVKGPNYREIKKNNKYGWVDPDGKTLLEPKYDTIYNKNLDFMFKVYTIKNNILDSLGWFDWKISQDDFCNAFQKNNPNNKPQDIGLSSSSNVSTLPKKTPKINNFPDSRLSELTVGNYTIKYLVDEVYQKIYTHFNSRSLLGISPSKNEVQKSIKEADQEIIKAIENRLGGPMTKAQLQEFNQIKNNAAAVSNIAMGLIAESLKSDNSSSTRSSSGGQTGTTNRNTSSSSNRSSSEACSYCKPYDRRGHYVHDYDISKRTFINGRYIIRPGYKICSSCTGTGLQSIRGPGVCNQCNGEKLKKCSNCRGSGLKD
jgi:uncharacterized protein (TIGR02145 family)